MVATIALFFSVVVFNNMTDYDSNWRFVQHVLSMDTTRQDPDTIWRAITNPTLQHLAYLIIIAWEFMTAILCWIGCVLMFRKIKASANIFHRAKTLAYLGLFAAFILYMVGFIIVGSEWFNMWQSTAWNSQMKAGMFIGLIMFVMLFLSTSDN